MTRPCWLFIDSAATFGGHEVMLLRWLEELQQQARVTPLLLARAGTHLYTQTPATLTVPPLAAPATGRIRRAIRATRDLCQVIALALRLKPQLCIVAEGSLLAQAEFTALLRLLNLRTVIYVPLVEPARSMGFGRGALRDWLVCNVYRRLPQGWITLTTEQATQLATWSRIAAPIFTLPNAVASAIEHAAVTVNAPHKPLRVLVLGRFDAHQKGLDGLLDALASEAGLHEILHVSLVGDGPYAAEIQQRQQRSQVLQQMLSVRPWAPAMEALRQHDVLLLTSRYEGVPLVMLEAMALCVPVIASDLPGTRAMLPADCLFAVGDYRHALRLLLHAADPIRRAEITRRNHAVFLSRASGKHFAQSVDRLTTELLRLKTAPTTALSLPDTRS